MATQEQNTIQQKIGKVNKHANDHKGRKVMSLKQGEISVADDPTKAILSESGLNSKHLCDYVVNVATGCRHGCKFCYVPSTPNIRARPEMLEENANVENPQKEWGEYVLYRDGLGERLDDHINRKTKWKETKKGCGIVGISFSTDCYMDGRAGKITRNCVKALTSNEKFVRVLTRNPILALQDLDVFQQANEFVTIGSSISSLNSDHVMAIEPRAPSPEHRLRGLEEFDQHGVQTYVSMSPTYPTQSRADIRALMEEIAKVNPSVVFHEPINPRGANFEMTIRAAEDSGQMDLVRELIDLRDKEYWSRYAVTHFKWVQEIGEYLDLPIHLWPDKQLIKLLPKNIADWLERWRTRQSPEQFAHRSKIDKSVIAPPSDNEIQVLVS